VTIKIDFAAGRAESGMLPYLTAVPVEDLLDVGFLCVQVDFVCSDDIGADVSHLAIEVENIKTIVCKTKTIYILEI
jgi:hypothetical protein